MKWGKEMNWLLRYLMGFPARQEDYEEIKRNFPELLTSGINTNQHLRNMMRYYDYNLHSINDLELLESWLHNIKRNEEFKNEVEVKDESQNKEKIFQCPFLLEQTGTYPSSVLEFMSINNSKSSKNKDNFFNLIKKETKNLKIQKIIITDPYFINNTSTDQTPNGFSNTIECFKNGFCVSKDKEYELYINPTISRESKGYKSFMELLASEFPKISIKTYDNRVKFHDRFYIAIDKKDSVGFFRPSINGLDAG